VALQVDTELGADPLHSWDHVDFFNHILRKVSEGLFSFYRVSTVCNFETFSDKATKHQQFDDYLQPELPNLTSTYI
jgi:hypothetical protein